MGSDQIVYYGAESDMPRVFLKLKLRNILGLITSFNIMKQREDFHASNSMVMISYIFETSETF